MSQKWDKSWVEHMANDSLYDVLGVSRTANPAQIKKAYRSQALRHHPDRNGGQDTRFKQVNLAHSVLSDVGTRVRYNNMLDRSVRDRTLFNRIVQRMEDDAVRFDSEVYSMYRAVYMSQDAESNQPQTGSSESDVKDDRTKTELAMSIMRNLGSILQHVPWRKVMYATATAAALGAGYVAATSAPVQEYAAHTLEDVVAPQSCSEARSMYSRNTDVHRMQELRDTMNTLCK